MSSIQNKIIQRILVQAEIIEKVIKYSYSFNLHIYNNIVKTPGFVGNSFDFLQYVWALTRMTAIAKTFSHQL